MTEKHDETEWKEEVAVTSDDDKVGGVGVDEGVRDEAAQASQSESADTPADAGDETVAGASTESSQDEAEAAEPSKMAQYDETFVTLEPGQIVGAKVVQIGADEVMVDVGYKSEGRIPLHELGLRSGQTPEDVLSVGDEIEVFVIKVEDQEGNVLLSKRRADNRVAWEALERAKAQDEVIEAPVTERVKGGLLVDVGVRGFIPASHVALNYVENLDKYVGQTLRLKVVELDRQRSNVVLSHKQVLEEEYENAKREAFERLTEGSVVKGVVRRITDFGAFVDIGGGVEGLLHVSEMAWSRVGHPSDVVSEGQEIDVMVLKVDAENDRISLSLKETLPDPWLSVGKRYQVGDIVNGTVTRVVDFGAFVKLEDGIEGLVHISQLADRHVTKPSEVVSSGQNVDVKVVSLDEEKRRIGLSIKQTIERPAPPPREKKQRGGSQAPVIKQGSGADTTVTLGEVFEDLSTFFDNQNADDEDKQ